MNWQGHGLLISIYTNPVHVELCLIEKAGEKSNVICHERFNIVSFVNNYNTNYKNPYFNTKVLLRDHKRHIARRVASTHSAVLARGTLVLALPEGVPQSRLEEVPQSWQGRYPSPVLAWGYLSSVLDRGTLMLGYPQLGLGYPCGPGQGYPLERTWDQRPGKEPGTGIPL